MKYCDIFTDCAQCPVPFCPGNDVDIDGVEEDLEQDDEQDGW